MATLLSRDHGGGCPFVKDVSGRLLYGLGLGDHRLPPAVYGINTTACVAATTTGRTLCKPEKEWF